MRTKRYPAKLLLFGEHTVVQGSAALAIPLHLFGARWVYGSGPDPALQQNLPAFAGYLEDRLADGSLSCRIDTHRFRTALQQGLYLDSDIPGGYGAGSSGAVCAAVLDAFGSGLPADPLALKAVFACMENFFHGASSGLDPLVCFLDQPLLVSASGVRVTTLPPPGNGPGSILLLDTGARREAGPLIQWFREQSAIPAFRDRCQSELVPANDAAIRAFLAGDTAALLAAAARISRFQFDQLQPLIPAAFRSLWERGLDTGRYFTKLCGAGGGGFLLACCPDDQHAREELASGAVREVWRL